MRFKKISLLILVFLIIKPSFAQNSPEDIANKFFETYKKENTDKALDYIFSTNKYSVDAQESLDQVKRSLKKTATTEGKFLGYELLVKKVAGQSMAMLTFLVKHEREPLTFKILFYKATDKWQVQNFKFDNKIDEELEEASRAYRFKENLND